MARLEAIHLQDYRGLRTEDVLSHKAVRPGSSMFVEETGHGSISHSVCRLDVHQDSIDIATADAARDVEVRHLATVAGGSVPVTKALRRLISAGHQLHIV